MCTVEDLNFVGLRYVARETHTPRAEDAALLIQFDQRTQIESFAPASLLSERVATVVARVSHVIVLQPAFSGLITDRTIDRMMKQQELHRIPDRFVHALGIRADVHVLGDRSRASRQQFRSALDLDQAHPATAFDPDIGMVAIPRDLNANIIRHLDDRLSLRGLIDLSIDRDLRHKKLD